MFDQLQHDWDRRASSLQGTRFLRRWARQHVALTGWGRDELRRPQASPRTDAMQAALVGLAQEGDAFALSTLLVQLVPGLKTLARRLHVDDLRIPAASRADVASDVVAVCCERVLQHDLQRRPAKIAANLLLDTKQVIWRAKRRQRNDQARTRLHLVSASQHALPEESIERLDLLSSVRTAVANLPGQDQSNQLTVELAYRAWVLGQPNVDIAADLGLDRRVVGTRLSRLRTTIRHHQGDEVA